MLIREAKVADVDALIAMGHRFLGMSPFAPHSDLIDDDLAWAICNLIDNGIVFVAEKDDQIVGAIAGQISSLWFNRRSRVAVELAWWVDENHRNGRAAIGLLRFFEEWAIARGATMIVMSDLTINGENPLDPLFKKLGYSVVERSHVKGI
jgi:hypothetical protein